MIEFYEPSPEEEDHAGEEKRRLLTPARGADLIIRAMHQPLDQPVTYYPPALHPSRRWRLWNAIKRTWKGQ